MEEVSVVIGGVTMASLLSQMSSKGSDMEGFLLGTVTLQTSTVLDDSNQAEKQKAKTLIAIQGFRFTGIPFPSSFYDANGAINSANVFKTVQGIDNKVVGWFRFRRNTPLRPSLREISVHSQLESLFSPSDSKQSSTPFLFAVFTLNSSKTYATHSYDYRFLFINTIVNLYKGIDVNITNLVHSSQAEYHDFIPLSPVTSSTELNHYVERMPIYIKDLETHFESTLMQLKKAADQLYQSTEEVRKLEEDIKKLS